MRQAPAGTSMRRLALGASKPGAWTAKGVALPSSGSPCKHVESMLARRIPNQGDQPAQRHLQRQLHRRPCHDSLTRLAFMSGVPSSRAKCFLWLGSVSPRVKVIRLWGIGRRQLQDTGSWADSRSVCSGRAACRRG